MTCAAPAGPCPASPGARRAVAALAAAAGAFALLLACFQPGLMSFDSFQQLEQARTGQYSDFHPPIMAFVWSGLDRVVPGPLGMLLLHGAMFFGGLALLLGAAMRTAWSGAGGVLVVALLPPVFANLGTIWKDVGLAAALVAAAATTLRGARGGTKAWFAAALPLLFYANAVRHNATAAVLPLAILWATTLLQRCGVRRRLAGPALGVALTGMLVGSTAVVDAALLRVRTHPVQTLLLYDLAGISVRTGQDLLPAFVARDPGFDLVERYSPKWGSHTLFHWQCSYIAQPAKAPPRLTTVPGDDEVARLWSAWFDAVLANPLAYLAHRWELTTWQFGLHAGPVAYAFHDDILANSLGMRFEPTAATAAMRSVRDALRDSVLFRGWFFVAVLLGVLAFVWRRWRPGRGGALAIAASGLLYALPLPLYSVASDFRLLLWTVVAAALGVVLCFAAPASAPSTLDGSRPDANTGGT